VRSGPQLSLLDPVDRHTLAVDLDDRQPPPVFALELAIPGDVHFLDVEAQLGTKPLELDARELAQMTVAADVQPDHHRYGYRPRMMLASATRLTARP
jgi:hypothetical protein